MNPENSSLKDKFLCGCCPKSDGFNSDEVIFDYFGRDFTEYEYVVENLAIRPAPKKLLDLVPVHSTNISKISLDKNLDHPGEPTESSSYSIMPFNQKKPTTGEGDFRKQWTNPIRVREDNEEFISFKTLDDDTQIKTGVNCLPKPYGTYSNYPDHPAMKNVAELRKTIKNKEYRTTKQILSDLYKASEESLNFRPKILRDDDKSMPTEIKDTIDNLKFKKPLPQFPTRTEKKLFHTPGVYFAEIENDIQNDEKELNSDNTFVTGCMWKKPKRSDTNLMKASNTSVKESPDDSTDINRFYSVDSTAQTEVSKTCPCQKKDKKNLKWKIIINKHRK